MVLYTNRLLLRRWEESDANDLFAWASDPAVGPIAGWPPHKDTAESLQLIRDSFSKPESYAICFRTDGRAIGSISLKLCGQTDMTDRDDECELGYWLGKPFWGKGIMTEAAREMLRHAFEDLGMRRVYCGYYEGNERSRRVQEKIGMRPQWTTQDVEVPLLHETRVGHVNAITKEQWQADCADYIRSFRSVIGSRKLLLNCAGALIVQDGKLLAQRRSDNGKWGFVGGMLELRESYAEAAVRESREETGLEIELDAFLGFFHNYDMIWANGDRAHTIGAYYTAHAVGGVLRTDEESLELAFFAPDELPELFAEDHRAALDAYLRGVRFPIPDENKPGVF